MRARSRDVVEGVRLVGAGFRVWRSSPRLMGLGLIPGAIAALMLVGLFAALLVWADDWARGIVAGVTGDTTPNSVLVALVALALLGSGLLLAVFTFTSVTLLIGQPFFERISDSVARSISFAPTIADEPWWRGTWRGIGEGLALLVFGVAFGVGMFLVGLIPAVGTATAFSGNALVGGTLLVLELTSYPLSRVGVRTLKERRALVRERRPLALGFGVAAFLIFLIPLGAVLAMPALVAGSTLLAARLVPAESGREALGGGQQGVTDRVDGGGAA